MLCVAQVICDDAMGASGPLEFVIMPVQERLLGCSALSVSPPLVVFAA